MPFIPPSVPSAIVERADVCPEDEMKLTDELRADYEKKFAACKVTPSRRAEVESVISKIIAGGKRYSAVADVVGAPWYVVGLIHSLECSSDFTCHLHNGDDLRHRTVHVPKGRPVAGKPPFTWEQSAIDALRFDEFDVWHDWSVGGMLFKLEGFNGYGYMRKGIASPYLFAGSQFYQNGKFVHDGVFDRTAVSTQIGAAVILRQMVDEQIIEFPASDQKGKQ